MAASVHIFELYAQTAWKSNSCERSGYAQWDKTNNFILMHHSPAQEKNKLITLCSEFFSFWSSLHCFDGEERGKNPPKSSRISSIMTCCDLDARQGKNSSHCLHMTAQRIDQHSKPQFHKHWAFAIAIMIMQSLYQILRQNQLSYSFFTNSLVPSAATAARKC